MVVVAVLLAYPLSFGPWFWLDTSGRLPRSLVCKNHVYDPLRWIIERSPDFAAGVFRAYLSLWLPAKPMEYHGP
jgi:hypothetical protein